MTPGLVLADRYEITGLIGRGGMGEVHRAHDRLLGRDVAIKAPIGAVDEAAGRRLMAEARVIAGLDHPNVVAIHDIGEHDGRPFFVMALVEGTTLADRLAGGPLSADRAVEIATDIAAGLHEAHRRGIVHRDVKPANVMIDEDGRVRVTDFGIAAGVGGDLTSIRGSLAWTAPEQARGQVDVRSDVYSLGCVLTAMLTGAPPYRATNPAEELTLHQTGPLPSLVDRNPAVPGPLEAVVHRMLAKDPADRPADMPEVLARLDAATGSNATQRLGLVGGTQVLPDPGPTRVLADRVDDDPAAAATTHVIGAESAPRSEVDQIARRRGLLVVLGVVGLLALVVAVALGSRGDDAPVVAAGTASATDVTATEPTVTDAPTTAPPTTSPPTSTPPEPVPDPTSLEEAVADLRRLLAAGRDDGQLSGEAVDKVEEKLDSSLEALQKYRENGRGKEDDKALDELDSLVDEVDKREGEGIAPSAADELRMAAARLRLFVEDAVRQGGQDDEDDDD